MMPQWEYQAVGWGFYGPASDDWPRQPEYEAVLAAKQSAAAANERPGVILHGVGDMLDEDDDPGADQLHDEWRNWRDEAENRYLNDMGAAGFELVTLHRDVIVPEPSVLIGRRSAVTIVRAYFKRERRPDNPEPPKPIGFRQPGA